ncbi:unnamed protein product [Medioppia subpectinata]|uniref:HIG1 domain-containing protein n=1 Tax=Medioppia subpectinata TaxID=1979941 RepID=A0A7R9Q2Z7_9ACAR|nr:unnamed protein product [Medioppia subpectinata]CAG2109952.1 unnamed protein product [Medioppia subpectinata]
MTGFTAAVLYGAYRFKYRPHDMPISLYLIQLRVAAQGVAVGSLTIGMIYMLGKRAYNHFYNVPSDPGH